MSASEITAEKKKITIIGGGISCGYMLRALNRIDFGGQKPPLEVEVIAADKQENFGLGLAWNPDNLNDHHRINTYGRRGGEDYSGMTAAQIKRKEVLRSRDGKVHQEGFFQHIADLKAKGVQVNIRYQTTVDDLNKTDHGYELIIDKDDKTHTDYVILATGHWQDKGKPKNEGVFKSPWPASKFDGIDYNQRMAMLGSSLSAVDGISTLAHNAGEFTANLNLPTMDAVWHKSDGATHVLKGQPAGVLLREDGRKKFIPKVGNENFAIDVYSRHGILPSVLGYVDNTIIRHNKLEQFKKNGFLTLDWAYDFLKDGFISEHGNDRDESVQKLISVLKSSNTLEDALKVLETEISKKDPKTRLSEELDAAVRSLEEKKPLPVQQFITSATFFIEQCYKEFSAEDQQRYMAYVHPYIARASFGMIVSNAEDVLALLESGHLKIHALGQQPYSVGTKTEADGTTLPGYSIRYDDKNGVEHNEHYNVYVDATGDNMRQLRTSSPLMKKLFEKGLADEVMFKYQDAATGRKALEEDVQKNSDKRTVFKMPDKQYYYSAGGMRLSDNYEVTTDQQPSNSNIFALGPPAASYTPIVQGAGPIDIASKAIVKTIARRMLKDLQIKTGIEKSPIRARQFDDVVFVKTAETPFITAIVDDKKAPDEARWQEMIAQIFRQQNLGGEFNVVIRRKSQTPSVVLETLDDVLAAERQRGISVADFFG